MWNMKFLSSNQKSAHDQVNKEVESQKVIPSGVASMVHDAIDAVGDPGIDKGVFVECYGHCPDYLKLTECNMTLSVTVLDLPKDFPT